jgi:hypothetical protein
MAFRNTPDDRALLHGMESSGPLDRPAEIYAPFSADDRETLTAYVANVRDLGAMRFFDQVPKTASITYDETGARAEMAAPDEQDLRAAITAFRQIYVKDEPTSAARALNILKRSIRARGGPGREEALAAISGLRAALSEITQRGIGLGIVIERPDQSDRITPWKILDTYFHGRYIHSDTRKARLARELDQLDPWARYTLYSVMWRLTRAYWVIANVAELALQAQAAPEGKAA